MRVVISPLDAGFEETVAAKTTRPPRPHNCVGNRARASCVGRATKEIHHGAGVVDRSGRAGRGVRGHTELRAAPAAVRGCGAESGGPARRGDRRRARRQCGGPVTSLQFLWVVAVAQGILLVALIILIILNRWFRVRRSARLQPRRRELEAVMQRWTMGQAPAAEVVGALARLPVSLAVDALVTWSARVPGERWQDLSRLLANQWWARVLRTNSRSARWWKRLECARFLSVAATPHDIGRVLRLLRDHHPAVQIAAATTLERLTSPVLVTAALDQLPH